MQKIENIEFDSVREALGPRPEDAHKGMFGRVLVIGGDYGMPGAARIAAEGALRVGAGVVSVVTRNAHVSAVVSGRPELLCYGIDADFDRLDALLDTATLVVIGPGLGQSAWSQQLFARVVDLPIPKLVDADGLNLLANYESFSKTDNWILTPHPGEAGRLLGISTQAVQSSRIEAIKRLRDKYSGTIVLKGQNSLVLGDTDIIKQCTFGNPGMATAGMGDLLSGLIAGLVAQGLSCLQAAELGVCLHAKASDKAIFAQASISVLASDVLLHLAL